VPVPFESPCASATGIFVLPAASRIAWRAFWCVAADEFHPPVYNHLRRVRINVSESPEKHIPDVQSAKRKGHPTQIVPVIDVLLQRDQL